MNWKKMVALLIAILILMLNVFIVKEKIMNFSGGGLTDFSKKPEYTESVIEHGDYNSQIAVITIDDVIVDGYKHEQFMQSLESIRESSNVKGVILSVDSPGGGVYESAEIADKILQIKSEKSIPFYAVMGGTAASGGYYVSVVCDRIYAMPETITGSIGVIMSSTNFSELFKKYGIQTNVIKSGQFKDIGSSSKNMTQEDREILQSLVDSSYNRFVEIVAKGRKMSVETVKEIADGRIYDGEQALKLKLIDKFGYFEDVVEDMKSDLKLQNPEVVSYDYVEYYNNLFSLLGTAYNNMGKSELQKNLDALKMIEQNYQNKPMYLYGGM